MATAEIRIMGLALHGRHGVLQAERDLGQHFSIDLEITADIGNAASTDRLEETLHYGQVIKAASAAFNGKTFSLIEAAAGAVAETLLREFPQIAAIRVTVHKPNAPVAASITDLAVTVERHR